MSTLIERTTRKIEEVHDVRLEVTPNGVWFNKWGGAEGRSLLACQFVTTTELVAICNEADRLRYEKEHSDE